MAAEIFCFFKCGKGGEFRVEYGGLYFSISSEHWVFWTKIFPVTEKFVGQSISHRACTLVFSKHYIWTVGAGVCTCCAESLVTKFKWATSRNRGLGFPWICILK